MKKLLAILVVITCIISCQTQRQILAKLMTIYLKNDTISKIANEELEYEIIIIDAGFISWLLSRARPRGYYSRSFLEIKINFMLLLDSRVGQPMQFNPNLYEMRMDYDPKFITVTK